MAYNLNINHILLRRIHMSLYFMGFFFITFSKFAHFFPIFVLTFIPYSYS